MFNGSVWNGASFNGGAKGVRVLMASAVLSVSLASHAEPLKIRSGNTPAFDTTALLENSRIWVERTGRIDAWVAAYLAVERPQDLILEVPFNTQTKLEPTGTAYREGVAELRSQARLEATSLVHSFFASLDADSWLEPTPTAARFGQASLASTADLGAQGSRYHSGHIEARSKATLDVRERVYAGGITEFWPVSSLFAEAHLNGIQQGTSESNSTAAMQVESDRWAGGQVDAYVVGSFEGVPLPGRGVGKTLLEVNSYITASWWAYVHERAELSAHASLEATPNLIQTASAEGVAWAVIEPEWSRIVEPRPLFVSSGGDFQADPWAYRYEYAEGLVVGTFWEDGRLALRGSVEGLVGAELGVQGRLALRGSGDGSMGAELSVQETRTTFGEAAFAATGSVIRLRLSVNLTLPAPDERRMVVPYEDRLITVPYEDRTMVVS